jgi:nitroreductase
MAVDTSQRSPSHRPNRAARARQGIRLLRSLRAVRRFRDAPIPDAALTDILESARWCGSAKNTQPWQFVVVRDRETLTQLAQMGPFTDFIRNAAMAIGLVMDGEGRGQSLDCGRVAQNIMLAAHAHGIGSCIGTINPDENEQKTLRLLGVPAGHSLRILIGLGFPASGDTVDPATGSPRRSVLPSMGRKPLAELVHYGRFGQREPGF